MKTTLAERRIVREAAKADPRLPVVIIPGDSAPRRRGTSWHYETKGGTYINHPSAYSTVGWSNMRYVASSRRVEVGILWLIARCPDFAIRNVAERLLGEERR